ncbi:MAG TPA: helix-turn-helix domain-containing protein, partial [Acidimicrobiales bacterium]|nr:helix-turn-helix domain-containing protein [Acidimicrobiales bacterium]
MTPPGKAGATKAPGADDLTRGVGARVRQLRKARGFTLDQLVERSGVSIGTLSQLERGLANPSLAILAQVAHGLGTALPSLLDVPPAASPVVRRSQRTRLQLHDGASGDGTASEGVTYELLTPGADRLLEVLWVETEPGHSTESTPFVHAGEEVGIVIQGVSEVHVGDESYLLRRGDAISYASSIPHWFRN